MHDGVLADGLFRQTASCLNQVLYCADVSAYLIHTRAEYGSDDLHHVLVAHNGGVDGDGVFVHDLEVVHVELADVKHRVLGTGLAVYTDGLCESIAREASGITQQGGGTLGLLHLVVHGALYLTGDAHQ